MCYKLDLESTSTFHGQQKSWVASICMWCKFDLKIISTPRGSKNLGCIHLHVVQIKPKNCIDTLWQQENKVASICMWCKLDLKTTSELKGLANFDNSWKKNLDLKIK
jgi:hypothetical protein